MKGITLFLATLCVVTVILGVKVSFRVTAAFVQQRRQHTKDVAKVALGEEATTAQESSLPMNQPPEYTVQYKCAPWISKEERRVLFIDLATMADYEKPEGYKGGEYYVSSSMDWALRQLDFQVDVVKAKRWFKMKNFSNYRRTFFNTNALKFSEAYARPENHCKLRPFIFWPSHFKKMRYHPKQVLTTYSSAHHTAVGYFIHGLVKSQTNIVPKEGRHVLLLGKEPNHFVNCRAIMEILLQHNYTLHATCAKCNEENTFPDAVQNHQMLPPEEFEQLLARCRFVLGFGYPIMSPTPLVAMSKGTAFLNPIKRGIVMRMPPEQYATQHNPVSLMGKPYVYNYKQYNAVSALQAANEAMENPFYPYTPHEFRPEAMMARMCSILEDDSVCTFPNQTNATMEIRAW